MPRRFSALTPTPFRRFNSSPEVIRLAVMMYVRFRCPSPMLLYPHHGTLSEAGETGRYRVVGSNHELITATLDLARPDVRAQAGELVHAAIGASALMCDGAR